jgi:lysophospholipase L1-like esterase
MFTTRQFSTGAPFTLAGTPVISAYEDAGTTQITAGITLGVDHDSVTGMNLVTVVASGANGFDAKARDQLIGKIVENFKGPLLLATIPPQKAPRVGWEKTTEYNASLPETINRLNAAGSQLHMVDVFHAVQESGITDDGVHPNADGQMAIATAFFAVLEPTLRNLKLN